LDLGLADFERDRAAVDVDRDDVAVPDRGEWPAAAAHTNQADRIMTKHRIYRIPFASVYPLYIAKAEKKWRSKAEVDQIIRWLTGFSQDGLERQLAAKSDLETFFAEAPKPNPARAEIKGVVCGIRVENIEEPLMREIRYLDKLIDELAKGKAMEKILRGLREDDRFGLWTRS
jgi:hypothetical protein